MFFVVLLLSLVAICVFVGVLPKFAHPAPTSDDGISFLPDFGHVSKSRLFLVT